MQLRIEAKKSAVDISAVIDGQCKDYAKQIKPEDAAKYCLGRFGVYYVPFLYATNGRPYLKQFETKSGIWELDVRDGSAPKALSGWKSPEGFRRILFLVDRTALGDQALDALTEVTLEGLMTLDEIYDMKQLADKDFDPDTKVQIATVQSFVKRILYPEGDIKPATSDYDLIIVDDVRDIIGTNQRKPSKIKGLQMI